MYNSYKKFSPKKPVHKFTDLEVYQQTMAASVIIMKDLEPKLNKLEYGFLEHLVNGSTSLPLWLAEAHSVRFGDHAISLGLLEKVMAGCNKMVVYLEQVKGVYGAKLDLPAAEVELPDAEVAQAFGKRGRRDKGDDQRSAENNVGTGKDNIGTGALIDDLVKRYHDVRTKVFRLSKSWQKWYEPKK